MQITGAKGGEQKQHSPVQQPDTVASTNICRLLLALGEGEYAGGLDDTKIYFNDTPLGNADGSRNFDGVTWEFRPGTQMQEPIKGFSAVESETQVGLALTQAQPWTHLFSNTQIDAVLLRIEIAALMKQVTTGNNAGDINGTTVQFHVDLSTDGGAYQRVLDITKTDMISQPYSASYRINLPKAATSWQMRVVRDTPDSSDQTLSNKTNLIAFTEVIDANLRYPNTALLFVSFDAKAFQSTPKVSCKAKGRIVRVPTNYDPISRNYIGTWDGTFKWEWTNNPAWIWFDILTEKRFGLGRRVTPDMLDKWELYKIAQRCDAKVPDGRGGTGTEPRFLYDVYIQTQADAWQVIRDIAAGFSGLTYWGNNMFNVVTDMPYDKTTMQVLTRAAVVGQPTYSSGSERNRYSSAVVSYSDPSNLFNDAMTASVFPELVKQFKFKQLALTAIGCTRESEAQRRGSWAVYSNYLDEIITLTVGMDGYKLTPGTVFAFADEKVSGKVYGGRIVSYDAAAKIVMMDRNTSAAAGDTLMIRTSGGFVESRTVTAANGAQVVIGQEFTAAPLPNAVFVIDSDQLRLQYFRVTKQTFKNADNQYVITGAQYNDSKYDAVDFNARLDIPNISAIPTGLVSPPTNVGIAAYDVVAQGQRLTVMRATWDAPVRDGKVQADVIGYRMQWRRGDNAWVNVPETGLREFEVKGIYEGDYLVRVQAFTSGGASSLWASSVLTHLTGRQGSVPKPVGLRTSPLLWGIQVDWGFDADTADTAYTELQYATDPQGLSGQLLTNVAYPTHTYQQLGLKAAVTFYYRARLVDRIGNTSDWTEWVEGESNANASDYLSSIGSGFMLAEDGAALLEQINTNTDAIVENAMANDADVRRWRKIAGDNSAEILEVRTVQASDQRTFAEYQQQVQVTFNAQGDALAQNTAAIATKATTVFDSSGGSAIYSVRAGVNQNGSYYDAGMSIAVLAPTGGAVTTRIGFNADQFVMMSGSGGTAFSPFAVVGGQVFINSAIIQNASINGAKIVDGAISNAKIANVIQSNSWGIDGTGWNLDKTSGFSMKAVGSGGSITLDSRGLRVYDGSGNWQVKVGDLS